MIEEDYVSFETAKLLKEKGFDIMGYASIKVFGGNTYEVNEEWITPTEDTIIPTLQMAMKWLREMHHIVITTNYANICGLGFTYVASVIKINDNHEIEEGPGLNACMYGASYEEACEAAIRYCLENLI